MTDVTGYRMFSDNGDGVPSSGDGISGGTETTTVPTDSFTPHYEVYVDYPSLGPVMGFMYYDGTDYWFVPDDPTGFPPNEAGTIIRAETMFQQEGTAGADSFSGSAGSDNYSGLQGDDSIATGDGNDWVYGDGGNDTIDSGAGNDTVTGGAGDDSITAGDGDDEVTGGAGADTISGGAGDDILTGSEGADFIDGGANNDQLQGGEGGDSLVGGAGDDTILGDGFWFDPDDYQSPFGGDTTTLNVTNSADGPIELWWISGLGDLQKYATIQPGETVSQPTFTGHNWVLRDEDGYFLKLIIGGNQTIDYGAEGMGDVIEGGIGNDTIYGQFGDDSIDGGDGNDKIYGGTGSDTLIGGLGNDTIDADSGSDSIDGGDGNDVILGGSDAVSIQGGAGDDTIYAESGNDTVNAGTGRDTVYGGIGDDSIDGGAGGDRLFGEAGNDTLAGGSGLDTLDGGLGDDVLQGGTGDDTLTGGSGDDVFTYAVGDGHDIITDFNAGNSGALGDGDTSNNDFVNLSGFYDKLSELRADFDDDGILNQSNSGTVDYSNNSAFGAEDSLTFQGAERQSFRTDNTGVACFTIGTQIRAVGGCVPVEALRVGDLVQTADNGVQPVVWVAHRWVDLRGAQATRRPIFLGAGSALGNAEPLLVSPQHRVLIAGRAQAGGGGDEVFAKARLLVGVAGAKARVAMGQERVCYVHFMTPRHEVVFANGARAETFWPGPFALAALTWQQRAQIAALFPALVAGVMRGRRGAFGVADAHYGPRARASLGRSALRGLRLRGAG